MAAARSPVPVIWTELLMIVISLDSNTIRIESITLNTNEIFPKKIFSESY